MAFDYRSAHGASLFTHFNADFSSLLQSELYPRIPRLLFYFSFSIININGLV